MTETTGIELLSRNNIMLPTKTFKVEPPNKGKFVIHERFVPYREIVLSLKVLNVWKLVVLGTISGVL